MKKHLLLTSLFVLAALPACGRKKKGCSNCAEERTEPREVVVQHTEERVSGVETALDLK